MKIVDAFTFFNEVEVLQMRLELLYDVVDRFYIAEADHTFSGKPKPFVFKECISHFARWADKIEYIQVAAALDGLDFSQKDSTYTPTSSAWKIEKQQRNALAACLNDLDDNDMMILSDLDEFINPMVIQAIRSADPIQIARFILEPHILFMNCRNLEGQPWVHAFIAQKKFIQDYPDLDEVRVKKEVYTGIPNAGWHFSYLGGADQISLKIQSFSHTEYDREEFTNPTKIQQRIDAGSGILGDSKNRGYAFNPIRWYPPKLQEIMRARPHLLMTDLS